MKLKLAYLVAGLLVLLAAAFNVRALDMSASADQIYISSTDGTVFVNTVNPFSAPATVSFSASSHYLNAYFDSYASSVRSKGSTGASLNIRSPDCFRGDDYVTVYAQVCSADSCQSASKRIRVSVTPAKTCSSYIEGYAPQESYVPRLSCGSTGCTSVIPQPQGTLTRSLSFDPTNYVVRLTAPEGCIQFTRGNVGYADLSLLNKGAAGSFDVRVLGDDAQLIADANRDYVSLDRSGTATLRLSVKADSAAQEGRHFVTVQLLHRADVAGEKDVCIDLNDDHSTVVTAASTASIDPSKETMLQALVENRGTIKEAYNVHLLGVPAGVEVFPQGFFLEAGETRTLQIVFSPQALKADHSTLTILAAGSESEGRASVVLTKLATAPSRPILSEPTQTQASDSVYKFNVVVSNEKAVELTGLSFEVTGLPSAWTSTVPQPTTLPASGTLNVPIEVHANTDASVDAFLVVKQGASELGRVALPRMHGKASGISGLFTLGISDNFQFILILLLLAILVIVMVSRRGNTGHDEHGAGHDDAHGAAPGAHGEGHGAGHDSGAGESHGLSAHQHEKLEEIRHGEGHDGHGNGHADADDQALKAEYSRILQGLKNKASQGHG